MTSLTIRSAYSQWPKINARLRAAVAQLSDAQLDLRPSPDRWPIWATIGHAACQRVFWLCDFAGAPGAATTRFTDASHNCPGDDDLEHRLDGAALLEALDSTFRIVERCLDTWTVDVLDEVIRRPDFGPDWVHARGAVIQRVLNHDVWHIAELNEVLTTAGEPSIDLWD